MATVRDDTEIFTVKVAGQGFIPVIHNLVIPENINIREEFDVEYDVTNMGDTAGVAWGRIADRETNKDFCNTATEIPPTGNCGNAIYYTPAGKQCERRYVSRWVEPIAAGETIHIKTHFYLGNSHNPLRIEVGEWAGPIPDIPTPDEWPC